MKSFLLYTLLIIAPGKEPGKLQDGLSRQACLDRAFELTIVNQEHQVEFGCQAQKLPKGMRGA